MAWSNFDTSMLPRIGYAWLLAIAMMLGAYLSVKIWDAIERTVKRRRTKIKMVRAIKDMRANWPDDAENVRITVFTQGPAKLPPKITCERSDKKQ